MRITEAFTKKPALRKKLFWAGAISLACPMLISALYFAGAFERPEFMAHDAMARVFRLSTEAHPAVALVMIDEASLKAMDPLVGRWPWPRSVLAEVIEFIRMGGPASVAIDVLFTEHEKPLLKQSGLSASDGRLVEATAGGGVFHALQIFMDEEDELNTTLLGRDMPEDFRERFALAGLETSGEDPSNNFALPIRELYLASRGMGVVSFEPDPDGVFRRTKPLREYRGEYFPAMGLAPVLDLLDVKDIKPSRGALALDGISMPLDADGNCLINMYGGFNTYSISGLFASIQRIRRGEVRDLMVYPEEFEGKVVFIGSSAVGVEDLKSTPTANRTPGVMLHASLASNMLLGDFLAPPRPWATLMGIFILSAAAALPVLRSQRLVVRLAVPSLSALAYAAFVSWGFKSGRLFELLAPLSALSLGFISSFVYLALTEGREKRRVRKMLGQYVSPQMLSEIVDKREEVLRAEVGSREYVTLLFSDIRDFTSVSESLPADRIVHMLNQYFSVWTDVIFKYDGTIDKFVGDAVMALWGAPLKTVDHAEKAVRAACEMIGRLEGLNRSLLEQGYPPIRIGIGIHSGEAILGNIGSERKLDYTVIGDTVNLASRIEGLTKDYSCDILISEATNNLIGKGFRCSRVDTVKVKGKEVPVNVYRIEGGGGG
jgi:adenylate cyclase